MGRGRAGPPQGPLLRVALGGARTGGTRPKAGDDAVDARIINTSSGAGLMGSVGQAAYSAAKAGIAGLTLVQAAELGRYGVTANAIAPSARTRMTEEVFADTMAAPDEPEAFDAMAPENVVAARRVARLAESADVTGRVFEVEGGKVSVADGWQHGPVFDKGARWDPPALTAAIHDLLASAPPPPPSTAPSPPSPTDECRCAGRHGGPGRPLSSAWSGHGV